MQIHIHRDEGHFYEHEGITTETWMPNRHAHMVFNWTDPDTGKSIKLKREDMREFQTLVSEVLDMERGVKSSAKHLSVVEYKNKIQEEKLKLLQEKIKPLGLELESTEKELKVLGSELHLAEAELKAIKKESSEKLNSSVVKGLSKLVGLDSDANKIKALESQNENLQKAYEGYKEAFEIKAAEVETAYSKVYDWKEEASKQQLENIRIQEQFRQLQSSLKTAERQYDENKKMLEASRKELQAFKTALYTVHYSENAKPEQKEQAKEYLDKKAESIREQRIIQPDKKEPKQNRGMEI